MKSTHQRKPRVIQGFHTPMIAGFLLSLGVGFSLSCQQKTTLTEEQANQMIDAWHEAASKADFDAYFGMMSENSIFIGTDAHERWSKKEFMDFARPYFEKGETWDFTPTLRHVLYTNTGSTILFDELLDTWMGTCRGSGIIEPVDNEWKIVHYHLAIAVPNEVIQDYLKLLDAQDTNENPHDTDPYAE